jgi:sugar/nucleoside kinase (ribokinase family)
VPITVVGSVALDTLETPFGAADNVLGGAASHFALAASYYDQVNLVAIVGNDFPEQYTAYLRARNIDLRGLQVIPGRTFRWGGRYYLDFNSRDTLFTELGVFADFHPVLPDDYRLAEILFLANIQPSLQLDVLKQASSRPAGYAPPLRALDTMNLWIETRRDEVLEVIRGVDIILIAEDEARQIAGTPSLRAAARYILGMGPDILVVKQGSYGALLFGKDETFFAAPGYPLEDVCDPTGAGDAFAGGFLGYLASCLKTGGELSLGDYKRALIHGNIMGSYCCEMFSVDRLRLLGADEISSRYRDFVRFTHFDGA